MRLTTERLELVPVPAEGVAAVAAALPPDWPDEELQGLLDAYLPAVAAEPERLGWGPWLLVAGGTAIGSAGFVAPPADGAVELGFGVHPSFRERGYATEAARALAAWALAQPGVERVVARCDPENAASARVLEKAGLRRIGEARGLLLWQLS